MAVQALGYIAQKRFYEYACHSVEKTGEVELYSPHSSNILSNEHKNYSMNIKSVVIENAQYTNKRGEIELPKEIRELIDNPRYENKFKYLARNWGIKLLLIASEIAKSKEKPSHYFAKMTAKANREGTRNWLLKLKEKRERLSRKLKKLGKNMKYLPYVMKGESLLGVEKVEEIFNLSMKAKNPSHYFAKAISNELKA